MSESFFSIALRSKTLKENVIFLENEISNHIKMIEDTKDEFKSNKTKARQYIGEIAKLKAWISI